MLFERAKVPIVTALFEPTAPDNIVPEPVIDSDSPLTKLLKVVRSVLLTTLVPLYDRVPLRVISLFVTSSVNVPPVKV